MKKEYLESAVWYRKNITGEPINEVPRVFDKFSYKEMRVFIYRMIDAAYRYDIWNDGPASTFLTYMETLEHAINVAYLLYQDLLDKDKPVPEYLQPIAGRPIKSATAFLWNPIPRMLTISELRNPARFLKQFFRFADIRQWKRMLSDRTPLALSINDCSTLPLPVDGLVLYTYLSKLIDLLFVIAYHKDNDRTDQEAQA